MKAIKVGLLLSIIVLIRADNDTCTEDFLGCSVILNMTTTGEDVPFFQRDQLDALCDGLSDYENCLNPVKASCDLFASSIDGLKAMYRFQCSEDGLKLASAYGACLVEWGNEFNLTTNSCSDALVTDLNSTDTCSALVNNYDCFRQVVADKCGSGAACYYHELNTLLVEGFFEDCNIRGNFTGCNTTGLVDENSTSGTTGLVDENRTSGTSGLVDEKSTSSTTGLVDENSTSGTTVLVDENSTSGTIGLVDENSTSDTPLTGLVAENSTSGTTGPVDENRTSGTTGLVDENSTSGTTALVDENSTSGTTRLVAENSTSGTTGPVDENSTSGTTGPVDENSTSGTTGLVGENSTSGTTGLVGENSTSGTTGLAEESSTSGTTGLVEENSSSGTTELVEENSASNMALSVIYVITTVTVAVVVTMRPGLLF